jgi:hypothetical protein
LGKKAQEESQLNWIFILIAGAVILGFFVFLVMKQRTASEAKLSGKLSQQLNTILVGAKASSGTVQEIPTPELSIRFTCNDYYIGPASQRLGNRVVFAPTYVEGEKIVTWTLDWNVPFKVTSFLYITSPLVRYVVVGDSDSAGTVWSSLPSKINKGSGAFSFGDYQSGKVKEEGDKYVRFIFVVDRPATSYAIPDGFDKVQVSGIIVDTNLRQAQFLVKSDNGLVTSGPAYPYLEDEPMYGAIFTDDNSEYACLMKRAYTRLNMVARVYYAKLNLIAPVYEGQDCEGFYRDNQNLKQLITATDIAANAAYPLSATSYGDIGDVKVNLKEQNTRLQLQSCSLIY